MNKEELKIANIVFLTDTEFDRRRYKIGKLEYPNIELIDSENNFVNAHIKEIKLILLDTKILTELGFIELENNYFIKDGYTIYRYGTTKREENELGYPEVSIYDYGFRILKNLKNGNVDLDTFLKHSAPIPYLHNLQNYFQQNNLNLNVKI